MDLNRREFLGSVAAAGIAGVAGCGGDSAGLGESGTDGGTETDDASAEATETVTARAEDTGPTNVGVVYATGGLGDGSFNQMAQTGVQRAGQAFDVDYDEAQPETVSDFGSGQRQFARSTDPDYDIVSCIGFLHTDALRETADSYPDQRFQIVDGVVEADNVASYVFAEHEGSFLVGHLAGALTTRSFEAGAGATASSSATLGFVGGVESPYVQRYEAGFAAGAAYATEDVDVRTTYVGGFNDPTSGRRAARSLYEDGADVVYHAAGNTGIGVFDAAQEAGRFAIGADRDQSVSAESYADVVLASMVKRVDTAVYTAVEETVDGEFDGGRTVSLGVANDGVGTAFGREIGGEIPDDVRRATSAVRERIAAGEIEVPERT